MNKKPLVVEEASNKYQMVAENCGLPKGYKQTEVGVIPEDWDVRNLGTAIEKLETGVSVNSVDETQKVYAHEQSILKTSAVANGQFYAHEAKKIAPRDIARAKLNPRADTIIISRMNTPDLVGESGYVEIDNANLFLPDRLWMTKVRQGSDICVKWLSYLLVTESYKRKVKESATGTSGSMKNISKDVFLSLEIPYPRGDEQRAIATALSDVDALLAKLDQLITKKRDLKQATMQQLLTGQTRLPGFSGDWEVKRLGKLFDVLAGGDFKAACSSVLQDEKHPFPIYSNSITDSGLYGFCSYGIYPKATITVTARGTVGAANYRDHSYTAIGRVLVLLPKQNLDGRFFSEFINNRISFVVESTGVPQLTAPQISKYELQVPNEDEQTAIATLLSDVDAEITALETRRDKTRDLKQGMMQELLTGRIRLV